MVRSFQKDYLSPYAASPTNQHKSFSPATQKNTNQIFKSPDPCPPLSRITTHPNPYLVFPLITPRERERPQRKRREGKKFQIRTKHRLTPLPRTTTAQSNRRVQQAYSPKKLTCSCWLGSEGTADGSGSIPLPSSLA